MQLLYSKSGQVKRLRIVYIGKNRLGTGDFEDVLQYLLNVDGAHISATPVSQSRDIH